MPHNDENIFLSPEAPMKEMETNKLRTKLKSNHGCIQKV